MGWLHSTPKRHAKDDDPPSRMARVLEAGGQPQLPDIDPAQYMAGWWLNTGLIQHGGMGAVPLSASEVMAWASGNGIRLVPWEFRCLREMSRAYLEQLHKSEKPETAAPYGSVSWDREVVDKQIRGVFAGLSKRTH